ncbi:MAG TPA: PEP-CTERM sorting domain-containing protein [Candidatus Acidoferrum sp.]|nr:PEP-CTERM sorting domain-containing protein [Candidatus Acidoferrum sp.]
MITRLLSGVPILALATICSYGQGTFIYDQQDSTSEGSPPYGSGPSIQSLLPSTGQSFTPSLSGIDFIRLIFDDGDPTDGLGASISLNLRSTSIAGPILGTTATVNMPNGFSGTANFFFQNTIPLSSGTTYYFDLNFQTGGPWNVDAGSYTYAGGTAYRNGQVSPGGNYWFREGLVVPEPSSAALLLLGGAAFISLRRPKRQ